MFILAALLERYHHYHRHSGTFPVPLIHSSSDCWKAYLDVLWLSFFKGHRAWLIVE
ncbi:MAG: hypothetical protein PUF00_08710 [Paraprevotella sp.]|nr:hypothetical protein [Paraprevotella sp.]MDD6822607.1 hypothetical protein [Paraprevotella sp.]